MTSKKDKGNNMTEYKIHPAANLVPMATETEQRALTQDIDDNGQKEEATLYRGKIDPCY